MQVEAKAANEDVIKSAAPVVVADFDDVPIYSIHDNLWVWFLYKFTQKLLLIGTYIFMYGFTKIRIEGKENLKDIKKGPVLIVANHKAYYDPPMIGLCFPFFSNIYPFRFMAFDGFFKKWWTRLIYESMGCFPAYRKQGVLAKSLSAPIELLKKGETLIFFPEGKCVREDGLGEAKQGVGILAIQFPEIPIVPIAITGTHKISGKTFNKPNVGMCIGKPFKLQDLDLNNGDALAVAKKIMARIEGLYEEISR